MDALNSRVIEVMVKMRVSKTTFATDLDVSQGLITHISTGRNKPGVELLQKILLKYPSVSAEWLLLGVGKMEKEPEKDLSQVKNSIQLAESRLNDTIFSLKTIGEMLKEQADGLK